MKLTTVDEAQTAEEARALLRRSRQVPPSESHAIIDMVITIVSYRFGQLKRREVEKMLAISFEETRVYKEIRNVVNPPIAAHVAKWEDDGLLQ